MNEGAVTSTVNYFLEGTPYEAAGWLAAANAVPRWVWLLLSVAILIWWVRTIRRGDWR